MIQEVAAGKVGLELASGRQREGIGIDLPDVAKVALITMGMTLAKDWIVDLVKRAIDRAEKRRQKKVDGEAVVEQVPDARTGLPILSVMRARA